jgi:hypothetical protein
LQQHKALKSYHPKKLTKGYCKVCKGDESRYWYDLKPPSNGKKICAVCRERQRKAEYLAEYRARKKEEDKTKQRHLEG